MKIINLTPSEFEWFDFTTCWVVGDGHDVVVMTKMQITAAVAAAAKFRRKH